MAVITQAQLDIWFEYHNPEEIAVELGVDLDEVIESFAQIRECGRALAMKIVERCPPCADTTAAVRKIREAVMTANAAIACGGS
jgi:hypothetical protein